ncbi:4-amino-4-deoxy-L-arabinose transferase and related glycosyltransferases of PMT family [Alteromonadaceae bacterium Bs31]|nr:4-amino-4-deoxy-L-arabinose transferase and related glycosyltransferases of PMT family [Alteromonadaceae bacterium Bs31]
MLKKSFVIPSIVFLLALAFRLWYLNELVINDYIRGDAHSYVQYSVNMVDHGVFSKSRSVPPIPDSYWAPGYPSFLFASSYLAKVFNVETNDAVLLLQALLGAFIVLLTWLLGRRFLGAAGAVTASVLTLLSPHLVTLGGYFLTEVLFCFLLALSLLLFFAFTKKQNVLLGLGASLGFVATYFVNPVILFAPFILLLAMVFKYPGSSKRSVLAFVFVYLMCIGAWSARGLISVPESSPSSSDRVFNNLVIGAHSDYHRIWRANPRNPSNPATVDKKAFGGSYALFFSALGERFVEEPIHYLKWYFWSKPKLLWDWDILVGRGDIYVYPVASSIYFTSHLAILTVSLMKGLHPLLFLCALGGAALACSQIFRSNSAFLPAILAIVVVYVSAVYVVLQSEPRYSVPLRPEMYLLAVYFINKAWAYLSQRVRIARAAS